jgi:menaquinone-dependent protoporphyrinogen oxidase
MSTAIVYKSSHGTTEKAVKQLNEGLHDSNIQVFNLKRDKAPDIDKFDTLIIGGSIHAGSLQGKIKRFCKRNMDYLLNKKVGLFLCCMAGGDEAKGQFDKAFPEQLRNHAVATGLFGGEYLIDKMNFVEKFIIKKISGVTESTSSFKPEEIDVFINKVNE